MQARLRLGIVLQGGSNWIGGTEYCKNLIKALYRLWPHSPVHFDVVPLAERPIDRQLYADMPARFHNDLQEACPSGWGWQVRDFIGKRVLQKDLSPLLALARRAGVDFLYPYGPLARDRSAMTSAAWIPDFQHRHYPAFFSIWERAARDRAYARFARHAAAVILSSNSAAHDFQERFPSRAYKAHVLPFRTVAPKDWFSRDGQNVRASFALPERFFIVCNQFWQHKNHRVVFEALAQLRDQSICPTLVCTGGLVDHRRPRFIRECVQHLKDLGISGQVKLLGLVPRRQQIQLIRCASAVIQPSLFEGWSTVVEDARALGKRLALSDIPVHREQNPPGAVFFPPDSPQELASVLKRWWADLPAGPDLAAEAGAIARNDVDVLEFAERFLEIARGVTGVGDAITLLNRTVAGPANSVPSP
jgi:glycosyltransferase involved in cell wall biosynthesis